MIPYSGGSSLEANFSAPHGGMSIDFALMDEVIALHENDMDVVVQPSMQWMRLNDKIKDTGLFFPVDPGPSAKIGTCFCRLLFLFYCWSLRKCFKVLSVFLTTLTIEGVPNIGKIGSNVIYRWDGRYKL